MIDSKKWELGIKDVLHGAIVSVLSSAGALVATMLQNGGVDWKTVKITAIASLIGYLVKKLPQGTPQA